MTTNNNVNEIQQLKNEIQQLKNEIKFLSVGRFSPPLTEWEEYVGECVKKFCCPVCDCSWYYPNPNNWRKILKEKIKKMNPDDGNMSAHSLFALLQKYLAEKEEEEEE